MTNWTNMLIKAAICISAVIPMLTSCYDDSAIWNELDKIEHRLDSLETSLNQQLSALNSLINGKTTIASCEKNQDGSYEVVLSNGTEFTVLAEGRDYSALVSVKEVNGVRCWATYDANGELTVLTDNAGNPIPVVKEEYRTSVEVLVEDGIYYLVIDGKKYMTGYDTEELVQVFSSCTPHKDASGNVYAMTFTFGEGMNITVAVDGYNGVIFKLPNAAGASTVLSEYYITHGETQSILLSMAGVIDYVMQVPDGWRISERTDELTNETFLDITAPAEATIESGAAVATGELKVVAVVEGGKAAITKLTLSAEPFKVFNVSAIKAELEPYAGVQKYAYGVVLEEDYDETALAAKVTEALGITGDLPEGLVITENGINLTLAEIYGKELDVESAYIFWAIPVLYSEGEEASYYVKSDMFQTHRIAPIKVEFSTPAPSLFDAEISIDIDGTSSMYAGTSVKSAELFDDIIYQINNGIVKPIPAVPYSGPASSFPSEEANKDVEFMPATTYVTWVVPVEYLEEMTKAAATEKTYTTNDIIFQEFTTKSVTTGGSLEVTLGEAVTDRTNITIPASSEGAELIYYAYLSKADGERYSTLDNDGKAQFILKHATCTAVRGSSTDAKIERVKPNTTMYLYIMAVDKDGKYGIVNSMSAKTAAMEYNSLTLTASAPEVGSSKATLKVEVAGGVATEFVYWFGKTSEAFYANSNYLGGTRNSAQQYMACYPDDEYIVKSMNKYGKISEDGTLKVDGLNMNTQYVLFVIAKDESGLYSKAGYKSITTLAADLGTIVRTGSDAWNTAKGQIKIEWLQDKFEKGTNMMSSAYALNFSCPKNLTAYILCSSQEYYDDPTYFLTVEDRMIDIENTASRKYDVPVYSVSESGELINDPNWIDDNGVEHPGYLMNICDFYIHGVPGRGFVTYFAEGSHGKDNCTAWDEGGCSNYTRAKKMIEDRCSLEYWIEWFRTSLGVTNETYLQQNAQTYLNAYKPFYEGDTPIYFENNGSDLTIINRDAIGPDDAGVVMDDVVVVLKDLEGNYYEPMYFPVPNYFN